MFDIGWSELLVIGMLALIVVGPKELPGLLRTVGQYVGKARSVAREFQRSMEDAAREADIGNLKELRDAKRDLDSMTRLDFAEQAKRSSASLAAGGKSGGTTSSGSTKTAVPDKAPAEPKKVAEAPAPAPAPEPAAARSGGAEDA
ncbi:twin-arginine translocase subunit TatB [Limibaculum sp. M0105]|uniref:Sec-independent protein translocase protein TatB n=1 Tax=Thermohalobaculum xanthum TaxID=2753746 RepID=A0A8J7M421_9RHOB|nr:Sec-independent protein translocase protein TatB [Thermohalobaculum xanthum]MBK0397799.1 twin-arginine translocase subunit TatB [Thermohalobaculum xanthum]